MPTYVHFGNQHAVDAANRMVTAPGERITEVIFPDEIEPSNRCQLALMALRPHQVLSKPTVVFVRSNNAELQEELVHALNIKDNRVPDGYGAEFRPGLLMPFIEGEINA